MVDDCPLRLLGHRALLAALRLWLKTARLCNMHMERTLSQINRSAPKRCHMERLIGSGFLVQLQALHASAGGNDIRHLTRAQLLKDGAPLRASKRRAYRRVPSEPTYLHWFSKKWADEQEEGQPRRTREQYRQRMRACRGEYIEASRDERLQSVQHFQQKEERRRAGPASAKKTYKELIQNKLWGFSSQESPVTTQCLDRVFEHNSSAPPSARTTRGMLSFRQLRE